MNRATILLLTRLIAVAGLIAVTASAAYAEGGDNPLVFPQRAHVEVDTPWLAGESALQLGGNDIVFAPEMGEKGRFRGFIRVGSAAAPMKGKLKCKKGRWTFKAKATDKVNNKGDLKVTLNGEINGRDVTGSGNLTQKSTQTKVKKADLTGRLAGNYPDRFAHIQFHFEPNARAGTPPNLESFVFTPRGIVTLKKFKCRSKPNGDGTDTVRIDVKGKGVKAKFKGVNDGNDVTLTGSGKVDIYKWKDVEFTLPNLPVTRPNAFATGSDSKTIVIPPNGCLVTDCILTTSEGVVVTIPAGAKLRTRSGALITGRVRITVDDGGGVRVLPGHTMADGSIRVVVDLMGPTGDVGLRRIYTASSDLDIEIDMSGAGGGGGGAQLVTRIKRVPSSVTRTYDNELGNPAPAIVDTDAFATCPCTFTPFEDCTFESKLDCDENLGGTDGIFLSNVTGSFTVGGVSVDPAPPASGDVSDFDISAGDDTSEYPRLKRVEVSSLDGKHLIATGVFTDPGLTLNETGTIHGRTGGAVGTVTMVGSGGGRKLRLDVPHSNLWRITAHFCDEFGGEFSEDLVDSDSDDGESNLLATYLGPVRICLGTRGDYHSSLRVRISRALRAGLPDAAVLSQPFWTPPLDGFGDDLFKWRLSGYGLSVRTLRDILDAGGVDVNSLAFTYTDRAVGIELADKNVPPRVLFADLANEFVQFLDLGTGQVLAPEIHLGGRPDFTAVSRNGCFAYAIVRRFLYVIDAKRRVILRRIKLKGNGTGLAVDRTGSQVYVTTDKGDFQARDAVDLHEIWKIGGFPREFLTSISVPLGGGTVWFTSPLTNQLFSIDTMRLTRGPQFTVNGIQSVAVSYGGTRLAATKLSAGLVTFLDLEAGLPFSDVPSGGTIPIEPVWDLDDTRVFVGNQGTSTIGVIDALGLTLDATIVDVAGTDSLEIVPFEFTDGPFEPDLTGLSAGFLGAEIFADGFESGDVSSWSRSETSEVKASR